MKAKLISKQLLRVLALALVVRMAFFLALEPWSPQVLSEKIIISDAMEYNRLALSILETHSFVEFTGLRTPGYPLFIAFLYGISGNATWFVLLIQVLINLLSLIVLYKIAARIFNPKVAVLSAFLFAIDVHQSLFSVTLYSDSVYVFLLLTSVLLFIKGIDEDRYRWIIISAIIVGISAMQRPVSTLLPAVFGAFLLFFSRLKPSKAIRISLIYCFFMLILISPWVTRNYFTYGEAHLTSQSGSNLLFCNVAYTEAYKSGLPFDQVSERLFAESNLLIPDSVKGNLFKESVVYSQMAKSYIRSNLAIYLERHFMGIVNLYTALSTSHISMVFNLRSNPLNEGQEYGPNIFIRLKDFFLSKSSAELFLSILIGLYLIFNYLFSGLVPLISSHRQERYLFLFLLIILYFSLVTGVIGITRLRLPIMPFVNILAAVGLYYIAVMSGWTIHLSQGGSDWNQLFSLSPSKIKDQE